MSKLIIYGDSILRGITYSAERRAHYLCRGHRLESVRELGIELINKSRMGATIPYGLQMIDETQELCERGSTVLLEYGGNDCDFLWNEVSANPSGSYAPRTPEQEFIRDYRIAIQRVRERGAHVMLATLMPLDAEKYIAYICRGRSYDNIMHWLGDVSMLYRYQEHYNRIVEDIAREEDVPLLDLRGAFLLSHRYKDLIADDGIHPTDAGHDLIEQVLADRMASTLRQSA